MRVQPGRAQTKVVQYLVGHPETKAIIGLGSVPRTVAQRRSRKPDEYTPGWVRSTQDIITGIENGTITATVDQEPHPQGSYAVAQLAEDPT